MYDTHVVKLYTILIGQLQQARPRRSQRRRRRASASAAADASPLPLVQVLPPTVNIPQAFANGSDDEQEFVWNVALFLTGFLKAHLRQLETAGPDAQAALLVGLQYLLGISYVDDMELFKARAALAHAARCGGGGGGRVGV